MTIHSAPGLVLLTETMSASQVVGYSGTHATGVATGHAHTCDDTLINAVQLVDDVQALGAEDTVTVWTHEPSVAF